MNITEEQKRRIWNKAVKVDGYNSNIIRKDACGAWIVYDQYNNRDQAFGWEIDHIYPKKILEAKGYSQEEIDNEHNLRPLHWRNNVSKGTNYPSYIASVKADNDRNKLIDTPFEVNSEIQEIIKGLYNL